MDSVLKKKKTPWGVEASEPPELPFKRSDRRSGVANSSFLFLVFLLDLAEEKSSRSSLALQSSPSSAILASLHTQEASENISRC